MAAEYGFNPVPRSQAKILMGHHQESPYIPISDIDIPDTPVVRAVDKYVKAELSSETYNHSVRVYFYGIADGDLISWLGQAIVRNHFPGWEYTPEVFPTLFIVDDRCITLHAYFTISEPHQRI